MTKKIKVLFGVMLILLLVNTVSAQEIGEMWKVAEIDDTASVEIKEPGLLPFDVISADPTGAYKRQFITGEPILAVFDVQTFGVVCSSARTTVEVYKPDGFVLAKSTRAVSLAGGVNYNFNSRLTLVPTGLEANSYSLVAYAWCEDTDYAQKNPGLTEKLKQVKHASQSFFSTFTVSKPGTTCQRKLSKTDCEGSRYIASYYTCAPFTVKGKDCGFGRCRQGSCLSDVQVQKEEDESKQREIDANNKKETGGTKGDEIYPPLLSPEGADKNLDDVKNKVEKGEPEGIAGSLSVIGPIVGIIVIALGISVLGRKKRK